jgi:KipI family sensor histidine kinase inhibitor
VTRVLPAGDAALVVELGDTIDAAVNARVLALDAAVARAAIPGIVETVPTYRSLLVHYDPLRVSAAELTARLRALEADAGVTPAPARAWVLPVVYGGAFGEDLEAVARAAGLAPHEVVRRHAAVAYRVYMLGFLPGFAYIGPLDAALHTPRRGDPRPRVPAGSVGIGGEQTGVFSVEAPSGWHLLGRTPERLYDPRRPEPFLLAAGDTVRFEAVGPDAWPDLAARVEAGELVARRDEAAA